MVRQTIASPTLAVGSDLEVSATDRGNSLDEGLGTGKSLMH